jgi:hypothetical protein
VHLLSGDPNNIDSVYKINVQGILAISGTPTSTTRWFQNTVTVTVTNGFLVISNAAGSSNNKLNAVNIQQIGTSTGPTVTSQANHLVILREPTTTTFGRILGPLVVAIVDQYGKMVTNDISSVTVAIASGPGTFTSSSTLTVTAKGGIATLDNLMISRVGGYTLEVTDGTLTPAWTNPFRIYTRRQVR